MRRDVHNQLQRYPNSALVLLITMVSISLIAGCGSAPVDTIGPPASAKGDMTSAKPSHPHGGPPGGGGDPAEPSAPIADAGPDQQVLAGELVFLDGTGSSDPDGDTLTYQWEKNGRAKKEVQLQDADGVIASFLAPQQSDGTTFRFTLTVDDGTATSSDSVEVLVLAAEPPPAQPELVIIATPSFGGVPLAVTFTADTAGGEPLPDGTYAWDFGDSTVGQGQQVSHIYDLLGVYQVTLCLLNPDGSPSGIPCATASISAVEYRTADMPDSWLVLYNLNSAESIQWKDWYIQQWGIPAENTLGLNVDPSLERIHTDAFRSGIFFPVVNHLSANPELAAKIMGILVGYRVPGNFYQDSGMPIYQGGGGWSVANKLQNLNPADVDTTMSPQNPHFFVAYATPDPDRLLKGTLAQYTYITARIDAPTLADAQALTLRARAITMSTAPLPSTDWIYHDYEDPGAAGGDQWTLLRTTVEHLDPPHPSQALPWRAFESDGPDEEPTHGAAMRFSYYRVSGWDLSDWSGSTSGARILGFAMNSWGATTVRSTTGHGGRYVPNALFNGGFAGAVGATAEPFVATVPNPATMIWCLADGRTLSEAVFHANRYAAWMWELVGDPLLRVPAWFQ